MEYWRTFFCKSISTWKSTSFLTAFNTLIIFINFYFSNLFSCLLRGTSTLWLCFRAKILHSFSTEWHKIPKWFLFACCLFIPQDQKYIYMKSSKKQFCGIVVLERDLVEKLEPKCDHDFSPGSTETKKRNTVLISSVLDFIRDLRFPTFWNEAKWHLFIKKNEFFGLFWIVDLVIKVRKMKIK